MNKGLIATISILFLLMTSGCSVTRHLDEGEYLLRRNSIDLHTKATLSERADLNEELKSLSIQRPNTYLLGMFPYKVWLYNLRKKRYEEDSTNFQIVNRVVEAPVIFDSLKMAMSHDKMRGYLRNRGYFYAIVKDTVVFRKKRAYVNYRIQTGVSYRIDSVSINMPNRFLSYLVPELKKRTVLEKGLIYRNVLVGDERERLVNEIRNLGYYKFTVDNISFELDTLNSHQLKLGKDVVLGVMDYILQGVKNKERPGINIEVQVHESRDTMSFEKYALRRVVVYPDYNDTLPPNSPTYKRQEHQGIEYRTLESKVNKGILDKKISMRPGYLFSQQDYDRTLKQLNDLDIFQFVRIYFREVPADSTGNQGLEAYFVMSPKKKYDFQANVEVSGGDLYVLGTAANVSLTDNNLLKGANSLTTSVSYGLELGQHKEMEVPFFKQFYLFSNNLGLNFRLSFPKFLLPVNQNIFSRSALPKTFLEAGYTYLNRNKYFSLSSFNGGFGYQWHETRTKTWVVKPVFVNVLHLSRIDPLFQARLDTIPALRNSYQETFVEGENIEFVYNSEGLNPLYSSFVKVGFEEAGLLVGGIKGFSQLVGAPLELSHAHYLRFDFEARQYLLRRQSSAVFRFIGGVGIPYGKSTVLPYIKQFFVGGAYSIRGWRPRVLGPGSYLLSSLNPGDELFVDQSGDIKLELNAEYRFNMFKLFGGSVKFNGATFADAGNIWLMKEDPQLPGASFKFKELYQDIALSAGAGLRLDLGGFLVLRLDWAIPLKAPYVMENHGWLIDKMDVTNKDWRRKNMNLNLAIGYPF